MTLRRALEEYNSVYVAYRNFAERTRVEYLNDLEDLIEFLETSGAHKVEELKLAQFERYLAGLERRGFAGATRKRKTVSIRSFLTFLYNERYIETNLAKRIIPPFIESKTPNFLTESEYNRLRDACAGDVRNSAIIELLLQTGIRLSELTHLQIDDIELTSDGGLARIKGGRRRKDRIVPLNDKVSLALKAYLVGRPGSGNTIFFLNRFGESLGERGVQKMLRKYLKRAGLEKASVHTIRHTFGLHHAVKGTSVKVLHEVLGNKDVRSTTVYISLAKEVVKKEIQRNAL